MLHQEFIKCLTSGSWQLRGDLYHFLSPALQKHGYFTVDNVSDAQLNFEVSFENGDLYLYLNVDQENVPGERYRILSNYCDERISMVHEILNSEETGYEDPTEVLFERVAVPAPAKRKNHSWSFSLGKTLHSFVNRTLNRLQPQA